MATRPTNRRPRKSGERLHGDVPGGREAAPHARGAAPLARGAAFERVYVLVRSIPRGRVMTYGQISVVLGGTLSPRAVGWALHGCPAGVPWQRVVNASGGCSTDRLPDHPTGRQRDLLESEGVEFRADGTLDLEVFRHVPRKAVRGVPTKAVRGATGPAPRPRSR